MIVTAFFMISDDRGAAMHIKLRKGRKIPVVCRNMENGKPRWH